MYKWITENTKVTIEEYRKMFGGSEDLRQELVIAGAPYEEVELRCANLENRLYGMAKENETADVIEKFTLLSKRELIYDLLLARKMKVQREKIGWSFKGINFQNLSDIYPNNQDVLKSLSRDNYGFLDAIILLLYYSKNNPDTTLTIANTINAKGRKRLSAFVTVGEYVYDFAKNLVMGKEDYYRLYQVKPIRTYTKEEYLTLQVEAEDLIKKLNHDEKKVTSNDIYTSEFLCWPEAIIESLKVKCLSEETPGRK